MSICGNLDRFLPHSILRRVTPNATTKCRALAGIAGLLQFTASTAIVAACLCTYTPATLVEVLDASTMILNIKGEPTTVHLTGIDTPKLKPQSTGTWCEAEGAKALQAKQFASKLLLAASEITLDEERTTAAGEITAVIYIDNVSLGQELLYKYLAIESGEPAPWCD
ncbi:MAG: hypothetical protein QF352_10280 [Arenicellales bacterium]|nr:hypothetical protein [Arenicellales bacterium]